MNVATVARITVRRPDEFVIRRVDSLDDYRACEALQAQIWGQGDIAGIPLLDLLTAQENGGMVLGAFDQTGTLLGFVYSMLGLSDSRQLKHCSVLLAVAPEWQGRGLGYRLKIAQRAAALAQDIDLITWTFDPLLSRNAHLNIAKLRATASSYLIDVYGAGTGLNAGLDTDRLFVEWCLSSPPGRGAVTGLKRPAPVNAVTTHHQRLPCCASIDLSRRDPVLAVQVPADIGRLKAIDLGLAIDWRRQTRRLFVHYFGLGYRVLDFRRPERSLPQYVLSRPTPLEDRL